MIVWVLVAAAAILLFWPSSSKPSVSPYAVVPPALPPARRTPSYLDAVTSLQTVRHRLVETEQISEEAQAAIDTLTLALGRGSER